MKTKEFVERIKELGFLIEKRGKQITITDKDDTPLLTIYNDYIYSMDTVFSAFDELDESDKNKLFKLGYEYASTPLSEREQEKKYYIRLKGAVGEYHYLNYDIEDNGYFLDDNDNSDIEITQFTKQDIEQYGLQKFTDSELFELIEVK